MIWSSARGIETISELPLLAHEKPFKMPIDFWIEGGVSDIEATISVFSEKVKQIKRKNISTNIVLLI